jgi:hypothetical protein
VIVVRTVVDLKNRHAILEVMARDETGRLELSEHAVNGCQPDILVTVEERAVDVFGRKVSCRAALEDFQNLEAWQRYLQAGFAEVFAFHCCSPSNQRPLARRELRTMRDKV